MLQSELNRLIDDCVQQSETLYGRINAAREAAPADMLRLMAETGIKTTGKPMGKGSSGWMSNDDNSGRWFACYNSDHRMTRIRWTLAHLLGHYVYHRDLMLGAGVNETTTSQEQTDALPFRNDRITPAYETQANRFAVSLLFPEKAIRRLHGEGLNVFQISDRLQNSVKATSIRLRQLGLAH